MPDKERERYYLSRLRACMPDIPSSEPLEPEPPDFLFPSEGKALGIELTSFFLPPDYGSRPKQEIQSLRDQILDRAQKLHTDAGGPALYVTAIFNEYHPLKKQDVPRLAQKLCEAVLQASVPLSMKDPAETLNNSDLPPEIPNVRIYGSVDGNDRLWHADSFGWVASITPEHVQDVITRKTCKAAVARQQCDELWLVIVHDIFNKGAPAELTTDVLEHKFQHQFDRLLWFEALTPRVICLSGVAAEVE